MGSPLVVVQSLQFIEQRQWFNVMVRRTPTPPTPEIEAGAKHRLADEYDAAQERGEIKKTGNPNYSALEELPGVSDIGLTHKDIHEARIIRDAEEADPGICARVELMRPS